MTTSERVRLHITPFNPSLFDRYIPPSLQSQASNVSYHSVETFPERGFGYVELPKMEAQKLKNKLNGVTLKGAKIKIEEARPEKKRKSPEPVAEEDDSKSRKKAKKEKSKTKVGEKIIPGHELEQGRHIKRGWAEDKTKSKTRKKDENAHEGIEDKKMKFKTIVPPNKLALEQGKKSKAKVKEEKASKKTGKEVVVKEGEKTRKPTAGGKERKTDLEYEEGVGWVDEDGDVVEAEPPSKKRKRNKKSAQKASPTPEPEAESGAEVMKDAPALQSELKDDGEVEISHRGRETCSDDEDAASSASDLSSSSGSTLSSASETSSDSEEDSEEEEAGNDSEAAVDEQLARAKSNTVSNKNTQTPEATSFPVGEVQEIHPLEALFKRAGPSAHASGSKPPSVDTSFSFFNNGADDEDDDVDAAEVRVPQTPSTKRDLEWRGTRSAAPTPDTAAIGKRFDFSLPQEQDEVEDGDTMDAEMSEAKAEEEGGEKEESEFNKWFYANRGDLNRAWKKRRKEERKVVRQRENRRVSRRLA
jgi:hypothetical protein